MNQMTIKKIVKFSGTGIHTGNFTNVILKPAKENSGIQFKFKNNLIPLKIENIVETKRCITIGRNGIRIYTIEHLLAAIYIMGITNLIIEVDSDEIPSMDGSAYSFIKILKKAGIKKQRAGREELKIIKPIYLFKEDKFIAAFPSERLRITYFISFPDSVLENSFIDFPEINYKIFKKKIAPARTFGFYNEIENLLKNGLAKGGSLNNAVIFTDTGTLNKKLRFQDEAVRHKVLDLLGAISFLNKPVLAHFIAYRSGHSLDIEFIKLLLNSF